MDGEDPGKPRYFSQGLNRSTDDRACQMPCREALLKGDLARRDVAPVLAVFRSDDRRLIKQVSDLDTQIDRLNEATCFI